MYKDFYGLKEEPFNITPDPRFLYWSQKHQEAFRHLVYGVQSNKGLAVLTGNPGTGKTAILYAVIDHLNTLYPGVHIAFVVNSKINVQDLFCLIFDEFRIENHTDSKSMYLIQLKNFLVANHLKNEKNVLILDEAQNFHATLLEEIRLLSNMETSGEKLLHIFLVGQPQLLDNVRTPTLDQLKQRLGIMYNLAPLNRLETKHYIDKRLSVAGAANVELFTADALDEIFTCARGLPRLINIVCDNALLFGCAIKTHHIDRDIIRHVAKDMDIHTWEENVSTEDGLLAPSALSVEPRTGAPPVLPPTPRPRSRPATQDGVPKNLPPPTSDQADRLILQNTIFSEDKYKDYWDSLLRKDTKNTNHLIQSWQKAAEREARQRWIRLFCIFIVCLGLLGGIAGEYLGLWSLRTRMSRVLQTITLPVTLLYGMGSGPEAVQGHNQTLQGIPLAREVLPHMESSKNVELSKHGFPESRNMPVLQQSGQPSPVVSWQQGSEEKRTAIKKVVAVRPGETLSRILTQEYGEYTKPIVDLVSEANPDLRNIHFLEVGQRLILPERPE